VSASRAQTKASHKRAHGKAPASTPTRLKRLRAETTHNNAPVVDEPPDATAQKQRGHPCVAWTDTDLARVGEHEDLSGSLGVDVWLRADAGTRECHGHVWKPSKRERTLTSLVWFSATFPQNGLSRKTGSRIRSERYISLCRSGRQTLTRQSRPSFATGPSQSGRAELLPDSRPLLCQWNDTCI
jgi:hypothetical protein